MGEALERFAEDPAHWLRDAITAIFETFRAHRAVTLGGCRCACDQRRGARPVVACDGGLGAGHDRRDRGRARPRRRTRRVWPPATWRSR